MPRVGAAAINAVLQKQNPSIPAMVKTRKVLEMTPLDTR